LKTNFNLEPRRQKDSRISSNILNPVSCSHLMPCRYWWLWRNKSPENHIHFFCYL